MKRFFALLVLFLLISSCSSGDNNPRNPYLLEVNVQLTLDMNLPQYSPLQFPSNPVYIANQGNGGIIVMKTGVGAYRAFDASDPNHVPSSCSSLQIDGVEAVCGCEDANTYSLLTGLPTTDGLPYALLAYRVTQNGSMLFVSN